MKRWKREKTMALSLQWLWDSKLGQLFLCLGCALALLSSIALAEELIKVDGALRKMFPKTVDFNRQTVRLSEEQIHGIEEAARMTFEGKHADEITVYVAREQNNAVGYAFEDTVMGKWGLIHYLVGLDTGGAVFHVTILDYQEIRGRPIAKRRFLRQYEGKTTLDPLQLYKDIDGITGATISSNSLTEGVRKILYIYEFIKPALQ